MLFLRDYKQRRVLLSEEAWAHIQSEHQEILLNDIKGALLDPDIIQFDDLWVKNSSCESELFYQKKWKARGENYYTIIVVKFCSDGNFVQTAYTVRKLKKRTIVFQKTKGV